MPRTFQYYPGAYRRWLASQNELNALIASQNGGNTPLPPTATPVINPNGGSFVGAPLVTLSCTTPNSVLYYTVNGTNPDGNSTQYTVPFVVGTTSVLKVIAVAPGFSPSLIASAAFTISTPKVGTPVFSPGAGVYTVGPTITITATSSTSIRYTTDGSEPTIVSPLYSTPIPLNVTTALQARGFAAGFLDSDVAAGVYTIGSLTVLDPVPNPTSGAIFSGTLDISATCATPGALIYYTTDGSVPTQASTLYSVPISISLTTTFRFKAFKTGYTPSLAITATYTLNTVNVDGFYGSFPSPSMPSYSPYWTAWTRTLEQMWTTPYVINFAATPPEYGPYRYYMCQVTAPPIESGMQGIFALSPADFWDQNEFWATDANGWPCYIPDVSFPFYGYRMYRLRNAINGAFQLSIQHQNEAP